MLSWFAGQANFAQLQDAACLCARRTSGSKGPYFRDVKELPSILRAGKAPGACLRRGAPCSGGWCSWCYLFNQCLLDTSTQRVSD